MANPTKPFPRPTELTVASLSRRLEARALPRRHGEHEDDIPGSGERFFSTQDTCFSLGKPFPAAAHAHGEVSPNGSGGGAALSARACDKFWDAEPIIAEKQWDVHNPTLWFLPANEARSCKEKVLPRMQELRAYIPGYFSMEQRNLLCKGTQAMQATNSDSNFSNLYEGA